MNLIQTYPPLQRYLDNLKLESNGLSIRDLTGRINCLKDKKLFFIFNYRDNSDALMLLEKKEEDWIQLNNLKANQFFSEIHHLTASTNFSSDTEVRELAQTIYRLFQDPRCQLLDDVFLERNEGGLFSYLNSRDKEDLENIELLKSYCKKLECERVQGGWLLSFNLMNRKGGIHNWNLLIGDKTGTIKISELEKDQSFVYPNIH